MHANGKLIAIALYIASAYVYSLSFMIMCKLNINIIDIIMHYVYCIRNKY